MNGAMPFPIKCLGDVEKVDLTKLPHISSGIKSLDRIIKGLFDSQLIVVTGERGQGKSTLASWILANALDQDRNIFAYSGELPDYNFRSWLDFQIAGSQNIDTTYNEWNDADYTLKSEAAVKLSEFYQGRAYIYDNSAVTQGKLQDVLLGSVKYAADNLGCTLFLIDNIMTAVSAGEDMYAVQSNFVKDLKAIASTKNVTIIMIAHPRKTERGKALENNDVSGTSDITNLADTILTYSRISDDKSDYDSEIQVTKNRLTGKLATKTQSIKVHYSEKTKRIISDDDKEPNRSMCCFKNTYVPF